MSVESVDSPTPPLRAMDLGAMRALVESIGQPAYRARQIYEWIHRRGAVSFDEMTNLPKSMRDRLAERARIGAIERIDTTGAETGTRKIVWRLDDGKVVESVLMRDEGAGRTSLCLSSQVGCAVGCTFCLTGYGGFQRDCRPEEIVGQVLGVRRELLMEDERLHSLVFMGMGEPMHNLESVVEAIRLITDPEGIAISPRRITVSTAGIVPGIEAFGRAETGANLAVSLNATTDEVRSAIMPLNKKWPIAELIGACARFPMKPRQRLTIEYVLMRGVNDAEEDARRLTTLLRPLRCKVNLIVFNRHDLLDFEPVDEATLEMFTRTLSDAHYTATVRWSKGREIEAACGQLAAHYFQRMTA